MICVKQIINDVFASNTYVLSNDNSNDYWLVDVGDFDKVVDILPENANLKGVFLTHSHFDHIYGLNEMCKYFPDSIVYTSEYGKEAICSEKKNFSFYHESPMAYKGENVIILKDNDKVQLWNDIFMDVVATPGHCPSCLTYITGRYIFTGDSYIPDVPLVTKLPKGNKKLGAESLVKILKLANGKNICAGHGDVIINI